MCVPIWPSSVVQICWLWERPKHLHSFCVRALWNTSLCIWKFWIPNWKLNLWCERMHWVFPLLNSGCVWFVMVAGCSIHNHHFDFNVLLLRLLKRTRLIVPCGAFCSDLPTTTEFNIDILNLLLLPITAKDFRNHRIGEPPHSCVTGFVFNPNENFSILIIESFKIPIYINSSSWYCIRS